MMNLRLLGYATSVVAIALVVGCGGAKDSDLFSPPGSSEFGTEPSGGSDDTNASYSPSTSGSGGPSSGGASSSSSSSGAGAPPSSSSSGGSGTGSGDSAGGSNGGLSKDAGPPASPIYCGPKRNAANKTCKAGTEVCCGTWSGGPRPSFDCKPAGPAACADGTPVACDDASDCPTGQVCCGLLGVTSGYSRVECRTTCKDFPGVRAIRFCDPKAAVDECSTFNKRCADSQSLPGFHVCVD